MKVIDKEALKKLIDDLVISDFKIEEPIESIDLSTLAGKEHEHHRHGDVKLIITGRVTKPDAQL